MRLTSVTFERTNSEKGPLATAIVALSGDYTGIELNLSIWRSKADANDYQVSLPGNRFSKPVTVAPIYKLFAEPVMDESGAAKLDESGEPIQRVERIPVKGTENAEGRNLLHGMTVAVKAAYLEHLRLNQPDYAEYAITF